MKATIIYPQKVTFLVDVPAEEQQDLLSILEFCFHATQIELEVSVLRELSVGPKIMRNSMVGDVFVVLDRYFMVDTIGFVEVSPRQAIFVQSLHDVERLLGWRWLEAQTAVGKPIRLMDGDEPTEAGQAGGPNRESN